jgi:flagellar biosynthesis/type III secretory pathway protein FliH
MRCYKQILREMNDIEKIRQEIERRKGYISVTHFAEELLSFIDSLPEEKPSEDLEEAAEKYAYKGIPDEIKQDVKPIADEIIKQFIAGAEWQYQKDRGEFAKLKAKEWSDGYNEGIAKGKEQMTKDAVEGEVCGRVRDHINVHFADGVSIYLEPKNISHIPADISKYAVGDKVKIIIVKQ